MKFDPFGIFARLDLRDRRRPAARYAEGPGRCTPEMARAMVRRYERQQACPKHRMACVDCGRPEQPHFCVTCGKEGANAGVYQHETPAPDWHEFESSSGTRNPAARKPFDPPDETGAEAVERYFRQLESMHPDPAQQRAIDRARALLASQSDEEAS